MIKHLFEIINYLYHFYDIENNEVFGSGKMNIYIRAQGKNMTNEKGCYSMDDKILHVKNEMKRVMKVKGLTKTEKYNLLKEKSKLLSEKEKDILIKECHRDYESYDRVKDTTELVTIFLAGMGLLVTLYGASVKERIMVNSILQTIVVITTEIVGVIIMVMLLQNYRSRNMNRTKHMIDILEEWDK